MKVKNKERDMNPAERLTIWEGIAATARARLASVDADYPCADRPLLERIRAGAMDCVRTAEEFVKWYKEKLA